ncbi:MAG TPA: alpha-ribazole phosphatase family protein [Thiohalobacter sp.]|nr:alpha-ribazole phosphatase family protein [Thiohalobacter sp.]
MLIGLLRHGEVEGGRRFWGRSDVPLSLTGLVRMQAAADAGPLWDRVISSPLSRCAEFAQAYARRHRLSLTLDPRLQEMDFGAWERRSAEEIMTTAPDALRRFWEAPDVHPPPGGEALADFRHRALLAWEAILAAHIDADRILVVTHGGVIRVLLAHVLEPSSKRLLEWEVGYASLHCLHVGGSDGGLEVRLMQRGGT